MYLDGSSDKVTFKGNYLYKTSGRAPKVQDNTYLHIVNNYWENNSGHAFEIGSGGYVLAEGNYFSDVDTVLETDSFEGVLFSADSDSSTCESYIGRSCVANVNGGDLTGTSTSALNAFNGDTLATASTASTDPASSAGQGNL